MHSIGQWWMWLGFFAFVLVVLAIDMAFLDNKPSQRLSIRKALSWTLIWILCALLFDALLWSYLLKTTSLAVADEKALEFFTGFVIEKSLSIDNLFVFLMIFSHFAVPLEHQRRVLLYGILGAVVLRFLMIVSGSWLVSESHWVLYIFGLFLVLTGIKMLFTSEHQEDIAENAIIRWMRRHLRITEKFHDERFFVKQNGLRYATSLFLVLVLIEVSDVVFALDSVPAIFAITQDPFIVFTSNIFAILGLRAMYFVLADLAERLHLLKYGVALLIILVGLKMVLEPWVVISLPLSLAIIVVVLGTTVLLSLYTKPRQQKR